MPKFLNFFSHMIKIAMGATQDSVPGIMSIESDDFEELRGDP
jgi:hypothetical protein